MAKTTRGEQAYRVLAEATRGKRSSIDQIAEVLRSAGLIDDGLSLAVARSKARILIYCVQSPLPEDRRP